MLRAHSPALYINDESVSSIQKGCRRRLRRYVLFFTTQVISSGFPQYLIETLFPTIVTEDVCVAWQTAPTFIIEQQKKWFKLRKDHGFTKVRDTIPSDQCMRLLLETASVLADLPKNRIGACAAGVTLADETPLLRPEGVEGGKLKDLLTVLINQMTTHENLYRRAQVMSTIYQHQTAPNAHFIFKGDQLRKQMADQEAQIMRTTNWCHIAAVHDPDFAVSVWNALEEFATTIFSDSICDFDLPTKQALASIQSPSPSPLLAFLQTQLVTAPAAIDWAKTNDLFKFPKAVVTAIKSLHQLFVDMATELNHRAPRLPWFQAVFTLLRRGQVGNEAKMPKPNQEDVDWALTILRHPNPLEKRLLSVEPWAADKHTMRGSGKSTLNFLKAASKHYGVADIVSKWDAKEIAISHGEGSKRLVTDFVREGVEIANAFGDNPYHDKYVVTYEAWEKARGTKKARTRYVLVDFVNKVVRPCLKSEWGIELSVYQSKKEQTKAKKAAKEGKESKGSKKGGKGSKKGKGGAGKDEKKASKKRKRKQDDDGDSDYDEKEGEASDAEMEEEGEEESKSKGKGKAKGKKKKKEPENKVAVQHKRHKTEVTVEIQLSPDDVKRIKSLTTAQELCGAAKKPAYLDEKFVYKGPYDKKKAGDWQKVELTVQRTKFFLDLNVRTPTVQVAQETGTSLHWLCFQQLSRRKPSEWKTRIGNGGGTIIDRASTGLELMQYLDEKDQLQPDVVMDMLLALASRVVCESPAGDSQLMNLIVVEGKEVWNVDFEENRGKLPLYGDLWDWLFVRRPAAKLVHEFERVMAQNAKKIIVAFNIWHKRLLGIPAVFWSEERCNTVLSLLGSICAL